VGTPAGHSGGYTAAGRQGATVETSGLTREYRRGGAVVAALRGVDLRVEPGERVSIMGPSGCGKSTLLGLIGGLDSPTGGSVLVAGKDLTRASRRELTLLRRSTIGHILQSASLLPMLTARENVELPLALNGVDSAARREQANELLALVDLSDKCDALPEELSGGQQQRVAVARALAPRPQLVLADEPAGNLDMATGEALLSLLTSVVAHGGITFIMVTHEYDDTRFTDRLVRLKDGCIVGVEGV
jgi:putative ABC transport system ATP-binding protein